MSTRIPRNPASPAPLGARDAAELVALAVQAKSPILLGVHRRRLRAEDLEECLSQAALELVASVRRGGSFSSRLHAERVLEQRFLARVHDRRRAIGGRSAAHAGLELALGAASGDGERRGVEVHDPRADVQRTVLARDVLALLPTLARRLTDDQRLVIASQMDDCGCDEFCERHGWSREKYRKVAQRGRARLRALIDA
ncbi:MAG: hypothetical protein ACYCUM_04405 [Solirubrobacteraceae bacterium]